MKRTERRHLKEDPLVAGIGYLQQSIKGGRLARTLGVLVVGTVALVGIIFGWQQWNSSRASELLAAAMVIVDAPIATVEQDQNTSDGSYPSVTSKLEAAVPKLLEAAEAYPNLVAGIAARFQAAAALSTLGRTADAVQQYKRVGELDADGVYGRMANLGRADVLLVSGDYAQAIQLLEMESTAARTDVPIDAVLMRLGRAYEFADQGTNAATTFTRVVQEFPASPYRFDAERRLESLGPNR